MKRKIAIILTMILAFPVTVFAKPASEEDIIYTSREEASVDSVQYADGVTDEMADPEYWNGKSVGGGNVKLMNLDQIEEYNLRAVETSGTGVVDLKTVKTFRADRLRNSLVSELDGHPMLEKTLYANGEKIASPREYFDAMIQAFSDTGYTGDQTPVQYAVVTRRAELRNIPTTDYIGYSATDTDDEAVISHMNVNEPFVVKQRMTNADGVTMYYGNSNCVGGWVNSEDIAICSSFEEWVDAWEVESDSKDFVVVTQDKIVLEKSVYAEYSSELKLTLGTVLKEVPEDAIPRNIAERGPWNNYVVYIPTRRTDGGYEAKMALISQNDRVSEGYLPLTKANVIKVALSCLGNRYGWGGMMDALDCSDYTRSIYRCFGLIMPRNTSWQPLVPGTSYNISGMSDEEKLEVLRKVPGGSLLYFSGHTMVYLGMDRDEPYVISATGSLSDRAGEAQNVVDVRGMYSVIINSLYARRRNGSTWLRNLTSVVCVQGVEQYDPGNSGSGEKGSDVIHEMTLEAGKSYDLSELIPRSGKMKYVVSDSAVASVSSKGVLKAKKQSGNVTVTAYKKIEKNKWLRMGKIKASVACPKLESKIYIMEGETIHLSDYMSGGDASCIRQLKVYKPEVVQADSENKERLVGAKRGNTKLTIVYSNGISQTAAIYVQ